MCYEICEFCYGDKKVITELRIFSSSRIFLGVFTQSGPNRIHAPSAEVELAFRLFLLSSVQFDCDGGF